MTPDQLATWLEATQMSSVINNQFWIWPLSEMLHFVGLSLLIGAVGVFDLRILGFARGFSVATVYRLIPWGIVGFAVNAATGLIFLVGRPDQYVSNFSFKMKLLFIAIGGVNVLLFNLTIARRVLELGPEAEAPIAAKAFAAISLVCWFAVLYYGRMLPYLGDAF